MAGRSCDYGACRRRILRRVVFRDGDFSWVCPEHELALYRAGKLPVERNKVAQGELQ